MTTVAAKERGIVFAPESVRAILDGRKTQSRRVISKMDECECRAAPAELRGRCMFCGGVGWLPPSVDRCPYGKPGDVLWVRETWGIGDSAGRLIDPCLNYKADGAQVPLIEHEHGWYISGKFACWGDELTKIKSGWRSPRFMPKWASRLRLRLTNVGCERVNDISEADAIAEGIREDVLPANEDHPRCICYVSQPDDNHAYVTAREAFAASWDSINQRRGYPFDSGAWVWVLKYERVTP